MHSNMNQIAIQNGHAWTIFARSLELSFSGMTKFTMKRITVRNGHTQLMFAYSDLGRIPIIEMKRYHDRLVYIIEISLHEKSVLYLRRGPVYTDGQTKTQNQ